MSLAKRNNGCYECRMRRVRCDKGEPECLKCRKKGIKCSGQGFECRFSSHMKPKSSKAANVASVAKLITQEAPLDESDAKDSSSKGYRWVNVASSPGISNSNISQTITLLPSPLPAIEAVSSNSRMLFDHFSNFIAAKMVVFDFNGNGYRSVLLPLACQDNMVRQAVSVVAGFHLSQKAPHMRAEAENSQQAILSKLRRDAQELDPKRVFNISSWATIMVLLVGETITGSNNYVHLLELLSLLAKSACSSNSISESTKAFITEQTRMFELFGLPLSSERKGIKALAKPTDYYLDFMSSSPSLSSDPERTRNVEAMKDAIRQACDIYRNRALRVATPESSIASVERLRQTIVDLAPKEEAGGHALVWACFVAAAESTLPEHREFFSNRLGTLFHCTEFGTIPLALETLQLVWASQATTSWTEIVTRQRPMLIM